MVGLGRGSKWDRCDNDPAFSILFPPQDKQNEASYLRDHKEELTEELATTILQRVGQFRWSQGPGQGLESWRANSAWTHWLIP